MEVLRFDIKIPFWCSFKEFGTVSSSLTYPFPPPSTLFGIILNSMGKISLHCINDKEIREVTEKEYITAFEKLNFAFIVREIGQKIDDYTNILKRSRENEVWEKKLKDKIKEKIDNSLEIFNNEKKEKEFKEQNKPIISKLDKMQYYLDGKLNDLFDLFEDKDRILKDNSNSILKFINDFWVENFYDSNKFWGRTQVIRQRIIKPQYTIFITSENNNEYSLNNIYNSLRNPKRPLYCGESDDVVDIKIYAVKKVTSQTSSNKISSVIPQICSNSQIVSIPVTLRNQKTKTTRKICSIPNGEIDKDIECYKIEDENIVFL